MKSRFKAILICKNENGQSADDVELSPADLMDGDVTVAVSHSTVNYKDGLVLTGRFSGRAPLSDDPWDRSRGHGGGVFES